MQEVSGVFGRAFLVFLVKESKKRRRKQPGKLMAKSRSQAVNLPGVRPLMNPLGSNNLAHEVHQIHVGGILYIPGPNSFLGGL